LDKNNSAIAIEITTHPLKNPRIKVKCYLLEIS